MATVTNQVRAEDVLPVRSRVSWGAILSGTTVALAIYVLLTAFGVALGFTIANRVTDNELVIAAVVWAIFSILVSLFVGGYVSTQCTAGENKTEAVIYGLTVWGVLLVVLLWLSATGVSFGLGAMIAAINNPTVRSLDSEDGRGAKPTPDQKTLPDPRQFAREERVTQAAWWTFAGILVSMIAAICGAIAGSGSRVVLRRVWLRRSLGERLAASQEVARR